MRYGVPYKGSKNSIAEWVYSHFPKRNNFYDLFAGGCAILQVALMRQELAIAMKLNVFVVTDGVMGVINTDNKEIEIILNEYVKNRNISKKVLTRC